MEGELKKLYDREADMDRVWVVSIGAYSERRIAGVFSTQEKAEETADDLKKTRPQEPVKR